MRSEYPKLLVATEFPPNASGGGPAVVRQVLKGWPADRLCWWSCLPERDSRFGQKFATHSTARIPDRFYPQLRLARTKSLLLRMGWAPLASRLLKHTLQQTRPDAIWVIPHAWSIPPLYHALRRAKIGYNVSIHDFVDVHRFPTQVGRRQARRMVKQVEALYVQADTCDVISDEMRSELKASTGRVADQILRAGLESEEFEFLENEYPVDRPVIRIAYAGSILVPAEFRLFVEALSNVRNNLRKPLEFHLFGSHTFRNNSWFDPAWMIERGNLPEHRLSPALRGCDWGFSPMSIVESDPRYSRFSFPTKFVAYLAAGLPVITLGHVGSSLMNMAGRYDVGFSITSENVNLWMAGLANVLATSNPRSRYRPEVLKCARGEFNAPRMRETFHRSVDHCVASTSGTSH